jgi:hypothetical protein
MAKKEEKEEEGGGQGMILGGVNVTVLLVEHVLGVSFCLGIQ